MWLSSSAVPPPPSGAGHHHDDYAPLPLPPPSPSGHHKELPFSHDGDEETITETLSPYCSNSQHANTPNSCSNSSPAASSSSSPSSSPSSFVPGVGIMSLRRPLAYKDRGFTAVFALHVLTLFLVLSTDKELSPPSSSFSPSPQTQGEQPPTYHFYHTAARLLLSILAGAALAYFFILRAVFYNKSIGGIISRRRLLLHASHFSLASQTVLLFVLLYSNPFPLPFLLLLLFPLSISLWHEQRYWRRRVQEQGEFVVVLGEMTSDILAPSLPLCYASRGILFLQTSFLILWAMVFASAFCTSVTEPSSTTAAIPATAAAAAATRSRGTPAFLPFVLLLLNLYWTSHLLRKTLHVLLSGSVTRWFYSALEGGGEEEREGGRDRRRTRSSITQEAGGFEYDRTKNPFYDDDDDDHEEKEEQGENDVEGELHKGFMLSEQQQQQEVQPGRKIRQRRGSPTGMTVDIYGDDGPDEDSSDSPPSPPPFSSSNLSGEVLLHHLACALSVSLGSLCQAAFCCPLAHALWAWQGYTVSHQDSDMHTMPTAVSHRPTSHSFVPSASLASTLPSHAASRQRGGGGGRTAGGKLPSSSPSSSPSSCPSSFIRTHHPLALVHVAAYKKSFSTAARDVWTLLVAAGLDSILRTDALSHTLHALGTTAGCLTALMSLLLFGASAGVGVAVVLPGALAYILVMTALEPLLATVNAAYVSFAETPALVSQTFPLIFHRLDRIAEVRNF
ncbi:hypothetical protein VYU27_009583 [Nannochloropsis oceanica]